MHLQVETIVEFDFCFRRHYFPSNALNLFFLLQKQKKRKNSLISSQGMQCLIKLSFVSKITHISFIYRVSQKKVKDFDEQLHHDVITEKL